MISNDDLEEVGMYNLPRLLFVVKLVTYLEDHKYKAIYQSVCLPNDNNNDKDNKLERQQGLCTIHSSKYNYNSYVWKPT